MARAKAIFLFCLVFFIRCGGEDTRKVVLVSSDTDIYISEKDTEDSFILNDVNISDTYDAASDMDQHDSQHIDAGEAGTSDGSVAETEADQMTSDIDDLEDKDFYDPDYFADADQFISPDQYADLETVDYQTIDFAEPDQFIEAEDFMGSHEFDSQTEDDSPNPDDTGQDIGPHFKLVVIDSWPQNAQVYLESEYIGQTPVEIELEYGEWLVELILDGYKPYSNIHVIDENSDDISIILEEDIVVVTFISEPPEAVCMIDSWYADPHTTPFEMEFNSNSNHTVHCTKAGYEEKSTDFTVGTEDMTIEIALTELNYDTYCGWITGAYEQIDGTITVTETLEVTAQIFDDHCEVLGLEPPAPAGQYLQGQYEPSMEKLFLLCPHPDFCNYINCQTYPTTGIIDCEYVDTGGFSQTVTYHKM